MDISQVPNRDIRVTEHFLDEHDHLMLNLAALLFRGAMEGDGAVDYDVREAIEAMVRTYRTLQSGVYYETIPPNPIAASVYRAVQNGIEETRREEQERFGMMRTRDADILIVLVFLQRLEYDRNNGRKRGRAFIDFLRGIYASVEAGADEAPPSLIIP